MAAVTVIRPAGQDRHGDPGPASEHVETGCRIGWASVSENTDHKQVITSAPTVYFRRRVPDIRRGDTLRLSTGAQLHVTEVQIWEHARREGVVAGAAVICKQVE